MATVEKRRQTKADGTAGEVRYRVRWRDPSGKQRSKTFARRRDANAWATKVEHQVLSGTYIDPSAGKVTLKSYAEAWRATRPWAPLTQQWVETAFRIHLYPALGDRPIGSILPSDVQGWVAGLKLGPTSTANVATKLSSVFKAAVGDRVVLSNPCEGMTLPRQAKRLVVPPSPADVAKLAAAMPDEWRIAVALGSGLGLRAGEALGLTVDRVDFLRRQVRIDRQARRVAGEPIEFAPPKTVASVRTIPLPDSVGSAIAAHIAAQGVGSDGTLLHTPDGGIQSQQGLSVAMRAACKTSGLAPMRFHDLRHFYASLLIASGSSVKTVQARLGHANASETLNTYSHLWPDNEQQTRDAIDTALRVVAYSWPAEA